MNRITKIGITGATGFIGKHFVELFLKDGYEVVAYIRPRASSGHAAERLDFLGNPENLRIVEGRMEDEKGLDTFVGACDAVVHLAAGTKGTWENYHEATVKGTDLLLSLAEKHSLKKLVIMSSLGDYDIMRARVITEESPLESHPDLRGHYAKSKILAEENILKKMEGGMIPIILLRAGLVYARNMKTPLVGCGIIRGRRGLGLGIGGKRMPYVHVRDLYEAAKMAMESDKRQAIYNVVSDEQPRIRKIVKLYNKYHPSPVRIFFIPKVFFIINHLLERIIPKTNRFGRYNFLLCRTQNNVFYSPEKIRRELGWKPAISFEETMKDMVEFHSSAVRVGVVGCGFAFRTLHLPVLQGNPRIEVRFVYDLHRPLAEEARKNFPNAEIPRDIDAIAKDTHDVDFIAILTPPHTHFSIAKTLMEHGYNLLIEKPLTLDAREARELKKIGEKNGVKICVANNYRFRENVRSLIEASPAAPDEICVKFWSGPVIQSEDGWRTAMKNALLYEMAYHFIDIALMLGGKNKIEIRKESVRDELGMLTSLAFEGETERKSRLRFDLRLFPPYVETHVEARYKHYALQAAFYPETFRRRAGATNPVREVKANILAILRYLLNRGKSSHATLYTLFINSIKDPHEDIPVGIEDVMPTMDLIEALAD